MNGFFGKYWIALLFLSTAIKALYGQGTVHHWETVVYDTSQYRYFPGYADPGAGWNQPGFNDNAWPIGRGGFGYGDNDDGTVINPPLPSVFLRKNFVLYDTSAIVDILFNMDYDDGYIAYLNGVEIMRANLGPSGSIVLYNQLTTGTHEAQRYQGGVPDGYLMTKARWKSILHQGANTLAVEVHNDNFSSSDLSAAPFLSVGLSNASVTYGIPPSWFVSPVLLESSNLPLVVINTNQQTVVDEPRIMADMGIIDNGPGKRNFKTDPFNNYQGKVSMEIRGESSQMFPKKSYRLETIDALGNNQNVSLLGMPQENDWILYAPYTDKTLIRDILAYRQGHDLGWYVPRTRLVELMVNDMYQGVYVLMEVIKRDANRVDIAKLTPLDVTGDDVTGGYILRKDKIDVEDFPAWDSYPAKQLPKEKLVTLQYFDPSGFDLVAQQKSYIQKFMADFETALSSDGFKDPVQGYGKYIDIPSFIDFIIVNEIGKNIDAYIFSTYMYKEKDSRGGKLHMGPLWDFNLAYGNVDYWANAQFAPGWMYADSHRMYWFRRMIEDPYFAGRMKCRWESLRKGLFTDRYFQDTIDSMALVLEEAQVRNFQRWPILGKYVWPNQFIGKTYAEEIQFLKKWINARLFYMDNNLPGDCSSIPMVGIYPNPSSIFNISFDQRVTGPAEIRVYNAIGENVFVASMDTSPFVWAGVNQYGDPLAKGIYIVEIRDGGKVIGRFKVFKVQ